MRTTLGILSLAATALLAAGCGNHEDTPSEAAKYITVSTRIGQMTRVATGADGSQRFVNGDEISVYAWLGTATEQSNMVVNGVTNRYDGTKWTAETPMLWVDQTSDHYFLGIHPVRTVSSFTEEPFTLTEAGDNDLLVARKTDAVTAGSNPVSLVFKHVMAKLVVNLNFRNQFSSDDLGKVSVKALVKTEATVNFLEETATSSDDAVQKGWTMTAATAAKDYAQSYRTIVIPQSGFREIVVTIGGSDYTYTHSTDIRLEGGKYTTVNLVVGRDRIEPGDVTVNDWQQGETIEGGEAQND